MSVKVIAHRGYSEKYPENTLSAFRAALELGSDAVELDVHLTQDGELIVHHDYYLGSPDNGEGLIFKKDMSYIKTLSIADNEKIPTLQDVFETLGRGTQYELELKGYTMQFLDKIIALVKQNNLSDMIEFTSPVSYVLSRLKFLEPTFKTGIFVATFPEWMGAELGRTLAVNNALFGGADVLHCPISIIDKELINLAQKHHLKVHAADCNTEEDLKKAFALNVDQLSTDKLELALSIRDK